MGETPSSHAPPQLQGLTIEAVEWLPSGADSGLVRVRGRWSAAEAARPGLPELVLRSEGVVHRFESLPDARFARDPASWRGSYLVPVAQVTGPHDALWVEWPGGVRSGLPPLSPGLGADPSPPAPPPAAEPESEGGQVIDQGVLAERRARRAEAAEQAQARVAAEALRAVEALELQSAELERRLADAIAERDALAAARPAEPAVEPVGEPAAPPVPPDAAAAAGAAQLAELAGRRQAALSGALASLARLRGQSREWRRRMRTEEIAHAGDAARLAVLEAERATGAAQAAREALHRRAAELEAERTAGRQRATELTAAREEAAQAREALDELRARAAADASRAREEVDAARAEAAAHASRLQVESVARAALEDELDRDRAARAGLEADRDTLAAEVAEVRAEVESLRAELEAERQARAAEGGAFHERIAGLTAEVGLEQAAREQAEATAAAARRPEAEGGRMVADLDAAAAALREAAEPAPVAEPAEAPVAEPAEVAEAPAAEPVVPAAVAPEVRVRPRIVSATGPPPRVDAIGRSARQYPPLRGAIVKLAHDDPASAGRLLAALLPVQAAALANALDYDLTIRGVGTFSVTIAGTWTHVKPLTQPRPRGQSDFHLRADPLTLAELLAGVNRRVGRFFGPARFSGSRRRLNVLKALPATRLTLAEAARAGANLEPGLVYRALSYAVHPSWTRGERFTIAQEIHGDPPHTWYLTARNGAGLAVSAKVPDEPPDATVSMTREAFDLLLRGEPVPRGSRPFVRGDREAVARMKAWTDRVQGLGGA